ncbi:MAG TPA: cytochrome c oxidase subunit II [Longimicrobium sp.]|nr:cytochrome c oxidase subunit II [Longimicrobium sp.]
MMSPATLTGSRRGAIPRAGTRLALLLAGLPLLLAACGEDHLRKYPQTTFAPTTEYARITDWLFKYTLTLGVIVGLLTFGIMAYILVKFRYRPGMPEPKQVHGNTTVELVWTLVPAIIVAAIAVPTAKAIFDTQPEPPANALVVEAIGKQWWWEFRYPLEGTNDTVVTANEIHVPKDRPVHVVLKSDNVLHSFWVPQMGGKRDMITNRINHLVFTPEEEGVYLGQCAEFCGDSHALMRMRMVVHTPEGFRQWMANEAAPAVEPAATDSALLYGKQLVTQGICAGCHYIEGTTAVGRTGPALTHFGRRRTLAAGILENNAEHLHAWIANAPAVKPGSKMPQLGGDIPNALTDEQIRYIVAYLQSLQ